MNNTEPPPKNPLEWENNQYPVWNINCLLKKKHDHQIKKYIVDHKVQNFEDVSFRQIICSIRVAFHIVRRTEHSFHATRNPEHKDTQKDNTKTKKMNNTEPPPKNPGVKSVAREGQWFLGVRLYLQLFSRSSSLPPVVFRSSSLPPVVETTGGKDKLLENNWR
jgi:hypothetical protein